jgi:hypothetical protein
MLHAPWRVLRVCSLLLSIEQAKAGFVPAEKLLPAGLQDLLRFGFASHSCLFAPPVKWPIHGLVRLRP